MYLNGKLKKNNAMAIIRRNNENVFPGIFSDFFENDNFWGQGIGNNLPAVNIKETDDAFKIEMATPGIPRDDLHIHVDDNILTIAGEHREETNENASENENYTRREFNYNSFSRSFKLPNMVDTDNIYASCENGILKLDIPKREEAKKKPKREISIS